MLGTRGTFVAYLFEDEVDATFHQRVSFRGTVRRLRAQRPIAESTLQGFSNNATDSTSFRSEDFGLHVLAPGQDSVVEYVSLQVIEPCS